MDNLKASKFEILSGRGQGIWDSPGNKLLKKIIMAHLDQYEQAPSKSQKGEVVDLIMDKLDYLGARFLRLDSKTETWKEIINRKEKRTKVGHSLRDHLKKRTIQPSLDSPSRNKRAQFSFRMSNFQDMTSARATKAQSTVSIIPTDGEVLLRDVSSRQFTSEMCHSNTRSFFNTASSNSNIYVENSTMGAFVPHVEQAWGKRANEALNQVQPSIHGKCRVPPRTTNDKAISNVSYRSILNSCQKLAQANLPLPSLPENKVSLKPSASPSTVIGFMQAAHQKPSARFPSYPLSSFAESVSKNISQVLSSDAIPSIVSLQDDETHDHSFAPEKTISRSNSIHSTAEVSSTTTLSSFISENKEDARPALKPSDISIIECFQEQHHIKPPAATIPEADVKLISDVDEDQCGVMSRLVDDLEPLSVFPPCHTSKNVC